jgi:hypothetical protein
VLSSLLTSSIIYFHRQVCCHVRTYQFIRLLVCRNNHHHPVPCLQSNPLATAHILNLQKVPMFSPYANVSQYIIVLNFILLNCLIFSDKQSSICIPVKNFYFFFRIVIKAYPFSQILYVINQKERFISMRLMDKCVVQGGKAHDNPNCNPFIIVPTTLHQNLSP